MAHIEYYYKLSSLTNEEFCWIVEVFEGRATVNVTTDTIDVTTATGYVTKVAKRTDIEVRLVSEKDLPIFLLKFPDAWLSEMSHCFDD